MDIWENMDNLKDSINDMILQRNIAEFRIKRALEMIEHFMCYGYDGTIDEHWEQLNKLVEILNGGDKNEKYNNR